MARGSKMSEERKPKAEEASAEVRQEPSVSRSPDYKAQYGRVQAAVWKRELEERTIFSVSLTRSYRDKQDHGRSPRISTKTTSCPVLKH